MRRGVQLKSLAPLIGGTTAPIFNTQFMKTITIKLDVFNEALEQLKLAQKDYFVQSTQDVINELEKSLIESNFNIMIDKNKLLKQLHTDFHYKYYLYPEGEEECDYKKRCLIGQGFLNAIKVIDNIKKD